MALAVAIRGAALLPKQAAPRRCPPRSPRLLGTPCAWRRSLLDSFTEDEEDDYHAGACWAGSFSDDEDASAPLRPSDVAAAHAHSSGCGSHTSHVGQVGLLRDSGSAPALLWCRDLCTSHCQWLQLTLAARQRPCQRRSWLPAATRCTARATSAALPARRARCAVSCCPALGLTWATPSSRCVGRMVPIERISAARFGFEFQCVSHAVVHTRVPPGPVPM